jgi:hypothetical protein
VSRGCGPRQRRILDVLLEYEEWAVETTELKRLVDGDRSNLRRAVRGLLRRKMVYEWSEGERRYYELSILGWIRAVPLTSGDPAKRPPDWSLEASCCRLNENPHEGSQNAPPIQPVRTQKRRKSSSEWGTLSKRGKHEAVTQRGIAR